jgi:hypothetical protein
MKLSNVSLDLKSLILGAVVGGVVMLSVGAATTTGSPGTWDYKIAMPSEQGGWPKGGPDKWSERVQALLNDNGKDGWELVSQSGDGRVFYFKRSNK